MNKYRQIMDHVYVSEEMKERVLKNVQHDLSQKRKRNIIGISAFGAVAAAALFFFAIRFQTGTFDRFTPPQVSGIGGNINYSSAKELSEAVGFFVPELTSFPTRERIYTILGFDIAQIEYIGIEDNLLFRMSPVTSEISYNYSGYLEERTLEIDKMQITLQGDERKIFLAFWTDGNYNYSLQSTKGMQETELYPLLDELKNKKN